jgi:hypothetical protein
VDREIVEHDDIARPQRGHEHVFNIGEETRTIDGPIEDRWRPDTLEAKRPFARIRIWLGWITAMTRRFRRGCGTMGNSPPTG